MKRIIVNLRGSIQEDYPLFLDVDRICIEDDEMPVLYHAVITMDKLISDCMLRDYLEALSVFGYIKEKGKTEINDNCLCGFVSIEDTEECRLMIDITEKNNSLEIKNHKGNAFFVNKIFKNREDRQKYIDETFTAKDAVGEIFLYDLTHLEADKLDYTSLKACFCMD